MLFFVFKWKLSGILKTEMQFFYFIGPKIGTSVAPPSEKSTERGLILINYLHCLGTSAIFPDSQVSLLTPFLDFFMWLLSLKTNTDSLEISRGLKPQISTYEYSMW